MLQSLFAFLTNPSQNARYLANRSYFAGVLGTGALTGSAVSFYAGAALVWPFLWLLSQREWPAPPRPVLLAALPFAVFFAVEAFWAILFAGPDAATEAFENLLFLAPLPIWRVITASPMRLARDTANAAAAVSVLGLVVVVVAALAGGAGYRAELMAGNPSVLALVSAVAFALCLFGLALPTAGSRTNVFYLCGAAAAALLVIFAGTRILWPALVILPLVMLLLARPDRMRFGWKPVVAGLAGCVVVAVLAGSPVVARFHATIESARDLAAGGTGGTSIGYRLQVWQTSLAIIRDHPLTGVGPGNYLVAMEDYSEHLFGSSVGFSHAHNAILNAWVRSGIPGVLALVAMFTVPLAIALRAPGRRRPDRRPFLAFLVNLQIVYILSGMTGLTIGHDILDAIFVSGTMFALYGLFGPQETEAASPDNLRV